MTGVDNGTEVGEAQEAGVPLTDTVKTPMATNKKISTTNPENDETITHMAFHADGPIVSYQSVVGMLMWAMLGTQPDLAYVTGLAGRFSANCKACHWALLK